MGWLYSGNVVEVLVPSNKPFAAGSSGPSRRQLSSGDHSLMSRHYKSIAAAVPAIVLSACSAMPLPHCLPGQQPAIQQVLYFGAEKPTGRVTPEEWDQFLSEVVTPKFPQGLTAWQASGQWQSGSGDIVQEPSYVLTLVHPANPSHDSAVREISEAYKLRFQQEAVLQLRVDVCTTL